MNASVCVAAGSGEELVRALVGHSGCSVSLRLESDFYFVRKRSGSLAYNVRLRQQMRKQDDISHVLPVPRILRSGEEDGLLWFDMEYVQGHGFISYAPLQSVDRISRIVESLAEPLGRLSATADGTLDPALFAEKLDALRQSIRQGRFYAPHAETLEASLAGLGGADWSGIPRTLCHGDLTVENMLMGEDHRIVFIDLLDGPLESVWMDVAKLVQDLWSGWSLRSILWQGRPDPAARLLRTLSRYLAEEVEERMLSVLPGLAARLPALRALQSMRVLPYVRDEAVFANVVAALPSLAPLGSL